jgi:hypothetical protein
MSYAPPIIHHDFNPAGTNKGSLGSIYNITIPPTFITDPIHVQKGMGAHYSGETGKLPSCIMDNGGTFTTSANGFFVSLWFKHDYDMSTTGYYSKKTKIDLSNAGYIPDALSPSPNANYVRGLVNAMFFLLSNGDNNGTTQFGWHKVGANINNNWTNTVQPLIWSSYGSNINYNTSLSAINIGISDNAATTPATIGVFNGETDFHHLVIDYGSTDDTVNVYVDNVLITSFYLAGFQFRGFTYGKITLQVSMLDTYLNDFRIYNYAVTPTFIEYLYKLGSNTNITSLSNVSIAHLIAAGASLSQLVNTGKPINDIINAGYSIDALINGGVTISQLVAGGVPLSQLVNYAQWLDLSATSNIFNRTYVNNFIDLSGSLLIRNDGAVIVGGDVSFNNITVAGSTTFAGDTTFKSRLFIGNDISVNGNLYVGGDLSVNGIFSGNFANNVIPTSAIIDYPSSGSNVEITGNVRVAGDASFNGTRVDLSTNTILQVTGQVAFTDGTSFSTYDNNILSGSFAQGNVIFKDATFASVTCTGVARTTTKTTASDYRLKTNVTDLNQSYTVDNLVPIQYNNILSNKHEFGLIAHELQAVYPELVKGEKDGAEYQHVNYNGLIGVLVKEVQELNRRKDDLCKK